MISHIYKTNVWQAINTAYPNRFKEWELTRTSKHFWNQETAIQAIKWLIEEKLKWTKNDVKEKISYKVFIVTVQHNKIPKSTGLFVTLVIRYFMGDENIDNKATNYTVRNRFHPKINVREPFLGKNEIIHRIMQLMGLALS